MKSLLLACLLVVTLPAEAAVFKCLVAGKTIYSDSPCPKTSSSAQIVDLVDNTVDSRQARRAVINNRQNTANSSSSNPPLQYMSDHDINQRINELQSSINAISSTSEKIEASRRELSFITKKRPKKLSYDNETLRSGLRRDLGSIQRAVRMRAKSEIEQLYKHY